MAVAVGSMAPLLQVYDMNDALAFYRDALGFEFSGLLIEIVLRARLQFAGNFFVQTFDRSEFALIDIGDFLDRLGISHDENGTIETLPPGSKASSWRSAASNPA